MIVHCIWVCNIKNRITGIGSVATKHESVKGIIG